MKYYCLLLMLALSLGCDDDTPTNSGDPGSTPNILLIIADDMGKDATFGFEEGSIKPNTPHLNKIMNDGLVFNNFWVYPTCSPTRSSMITGKYGYRTGVMWANDELDPNERILQKYINDETQGNYSTAIVGKWHLSGDATSVNPESFGIDYYAGLIKGAVQDYYKWQLTEDGNTTLKTDYISEVFTDLSIDWINSQSKPWFLWLAYNAPHTPFHIPPVEMHNQGVLAAYTEGADAMPYYLAAIEALDFQIGKLMNEMPQDELDNTVIIFIGDNGTPGQVVQSPYSMNKSKGSLYQGGINVPMFISGKEVSRTGKDDNLICSVDLFSTIADLAGVEVSEINDSKSFRQLLSSNTSHRSFQYSEKNDGTKESWTISNGEFKLIVTANGAEELYDLSNDPYENNDLLLGILNNDAEAAKTALEAELKVIRN